MKLDPKQLVESALFVSTDPISVKKLEEISGAGALEIKKIIRGLQESHEKENSAIEIRKIGKDHFVMQAREVFAAPLLELVKPTVSQEVLKTLSLIALKQPIMQAEVVKARGPVTYAHVKELVGKDFVTAHPTGRTKILHTTAKFADYFGFPHEIGELKKAIAEQLGVRKEEDAEQEAKR